MRKKSLFCFLTLFSLSLSAVLRGGSSAALLPRAAVPAERVWTVAITGLDNDLRGTFATLQGQIAQQGGREQLYLTFSDGQYRRYLELISRDYGVEIEEGWEPMEVLKRLGRYADGYILYDKANSDSIQVATMMASYLRGVIVERSQEETVRKATGWGMLADASSMTLEQYFSKPRPELNPRAPAVHSGDFTYDLRDFLVMARSPINWMKADALSDYYPTWLQGGLSEELPGRPSFGWPIIPDITDANGSVSHTGRGEGVAIRMMSEKGFYCVPASSTYNLSVLSAYDSPEPIKQKSCEEGPVTETATHLVTFILTDGDNASFVLKSMMHSTQYYGSELRGSIPMGWGIAPALAELAQPAVQWMYENASNDGLNRDYFVVGPSGLGYCNPTKFPNLQALSEHCSRLAKAMEKIDLKYVQIIDWDVYERRGTQSSYQWSDLQYRDRWMEYLKHDQIQGLILLDYVPYNKYEGRLSWVNDKPVTSVRYMLWDGLDGCDNDSVVEKLNAAKRDLGSADGYSIVIVHCWSKGLSDVKAVMERLEEGVKVVSPDVFFETLKYHHPAASTPDF